MMEGLLPKQDIVGSSPINRFQSQLQSAAVLRLPWRQNESVD